MNRLALPWLIGAGFLVASRLASAQSSCVGSQIQIDFGAEYPAADYWPQTLFSFPHGFAGNASPDVDFSMQWTAASGAPSINIAKIQTASVPLPDGSSSQSPWFVIARSADSAGIVGTLQYAFSQPVGNVGFAIGSIDSGADAESVSIVLTLADGTQIPLTHAVSYATPPLAPSAWPSQPTVYYSSPGSSTTGGIFTGNGTVYIAIPANTPVAAIDVIYTIIDDTSGGIGFTPPTFRQCTPAPASTTPVPALSRWYSMLLPLLLGGIVFWRRRCNDSCRSR